MNTAVAAKPDSDLLGEFFEQLCLARNRVLLLDYDGTIAPFSVQRNRAFPYPTISELLDCIVSTCRTRVVLISGRAAREIPPLLGLTPHPEIWGSHGIERLRADGSHHVARVSDAAQHALTQADARLQEAGIEGMAERKPGAVAVHWRGLSPWSVEKARAKAYSVLAPLAGPTGLLLAEFDGGLELRVPSPAKADAVHTILSEITSDTPVAYLGDDTTDEEAFRLLSGRGLTILVRPTYRFTAAQTWLRPPGALVQFLADWVRACRGDL
jgi:trehalose-phosphatase